MIEMRHPADVTRALNEARNATTARAREAEVLKQELARLRAGSNGSAAPAAPDKGEGANGMYSFRRRLSYRREGRPLSTDGEDALLQPQESMLTVLLTFKYGASSPAWHA